MTDKNEIFNTHILQEIREGVLVTVGSYGERCQCDNSTGAGACPVAMNDTCSGMYVQSNLLCYVYLDFELRQNRVMRNK